MNNWPLLLIGIAFVLIGRWALADYSSGELARTGSMKSSIAVRGIIVLIGMVLIYSGIFKS
jgi:uncharacterized membrane protein HdeD (DUF308 family)